jgi:nitrite reductase/ring-hydroxylating ferredoxin subunit
MNTPHRVARDGDAIVVVRNGGGLVAFRDLCPHAGWRLSEGQIVEGTVECPGHGWQFDLLTGRCTSVPDYCLAHVSCQVTGGFVRFEWEEQKEEAKCPLRRRLAALLWGAAWRMSSCLDSLSVCREACF